LGRTLLIAFQSRTVDNKTRISGKALKGQVQTSLESDDREPALERLCRLPPRKVVNPLFSFLYHSDQKIRWRAVEAMGLVVARLADEDMESARVVMRRLMWNLNDESGGIGWGSPEALGAIMARHEGLAEEYAHILMSYAREDGNYLEHEILQRGLLWGIGRLAEVRPRLLRDAERHLMPYLKSSDAAARGLAARAAGILGIASARTSLLELAGDQTPVVTYTQGKVGHLRVADLAKEALERLDRHDC
jgi:HEAT repeat protein